MPTVKFTAALNRFFPELKEGEIPGHTVAEIIAELGRRHPGLPGYLVDDQGALRHHVNIFIGDNLIRYKKTLSDPVSAGDQVFIMQALSGG
ncbi:MAG: MoaD/ThiS family protein [Bacteroidia bacterium]|nr:MoaD/ThiS family protein [Bacteroidia bacterium]